MHSSFLADDLRLMPKWLPLITGIVDLYADDFPVGASRMEWERHRLLHTLRKNLLNKGLEMLTECAGALATYDGVFSCLGPLLDTARWKDPARRPAVEDIMRRLAPPSLLEEVEAIAVAEEALLALGRARIREHGFFVLQVQALDMAIGALLQCSAPLAAGDTQALHSIASQAFAAIKVVRQMGSVALTAPQAAAVALLANITSASPPSTADPALGAPLQCIGDGLRRYRHEITLLEESRMRGWEACATAHPPEYACGHRAACPQEFDLALQQAQSRVSSSRWMVGAVDSASLYVAGLAETVDEAALYALVAESGPVAYIYRDTRTDCAYVNMHEQSAVLPAQRALLHLTADADGNSRCFRVPCGMGASAMRDERLPLSQQLPSPAAILARWQELEQFFAAVDAPAPPAGSSPMRRSLGRPTLSTAERRREREAWEQFGCSCTELEMLSTQGVQPWEATIDDWDFLYNGINAKI